VARSESMDPQEVGKIWDANAPGWIELSRAGYDVYRDLLNTPAFLAMLPDVSGQIGLDLGCGEGHNTRLVAERGAAMVGLDISSVFARAARDGDGSAAAIAVVVADGLTLPFSEGSFDFVVGFMSLMDMLEPGRVLLEVARVLAPGGFAQFSLTHPCTNTPVRRWEYDESGQRVALATGGYFNNVPYTETWLFGAAPEVVRAHHLPFVVPRFPLTIAEWLNAVADAGLVLERAGEPFASEETAAAHPEVADTRLAPYFLHLRARRPLLPTSAGPSEPMERPCSKR
jgi:SAM-dependent methyltransferase